MMKRFGRYDNDFNNLFECYQQVNGMVMERSLPSETRQPTSITTGNSFPGVKHVKVFIQRPGRGADLTNMINVSRVDSDDGESGAIISGVDGDKTFNIATTKKTAQVKTIDSQGNLENDFVTNVSPRYDADKKELTIIHVEQL